jgi:hypothetical protein
MSDIFISYASEDRARAKDIAEALEQQGWSVWWDRKIPPGKAFDEVIGDELDAARCVIVLWSRASIGSNWVKEEAAEGQKRNILVPVLIEDITIPLGFRRLQAARLVGWKKNSDSPEFNQLLEAVASVLGTDVVPPEPRQQEQRTTLVRLSAAIVTLIVFVAAGLGVGQLAYELTGGSFDNLFCVIPTWLIGLVVAYYVWKYLK